jgi:hypothetical protein
MFLDVEVGCFVWWVVFEVVVLLLLLMSIEMVMCLWCRMSL